MKELVESVQPQNTVSGTKLALKTFEQWTEERNSGELESVPSSLLNIEDPSELWKYLSLFVVETWKNKYRPATLHQILCGIQRHVR